jgi:hypothetical protein
LPVKGDYRKIGRLSTDGDKPIDKRTVGGTPGSRVRNVRMRFGKRNQVEIQPGMNAGMLIEP